MQSSRFVSSPFYACVSKHFRRPSSGRSCNGPAGAELRYGLDDLQNVSILFCCMIDTTFRDLTTHL